MTAGARAGTHTIEVRNGGAPQFSRRMGLAAGASGSKCATASSASLRTAADSAGNHWLFNRTAALFDRARGELQSEHRGMPQGTPLHRFAPTMDMCLSRCQSTRRSAAATRFCAKRRRSAQRSHTQASIVIEQGELVVKAVLADRAAGPPMRAGARGTSNRHCGQAKAAGP